MTTERQMPAWFLELDEVERADLEKVGLDPVTQGEMEAAAEMDAEASWLLRQVAETRADLARYERAMGREIDVVKARYEGITAPARRRLARLDAALRELAMTTDFGAQKSRLVAWGSYGRRQKPDALQVEDRERAVSWAMKNRPGALKVTLAGSWQLLSVAPAVEGVTVKQDVSVTELKKHAKETGEVPDGCAFTRAHDEPFYDAFEVPQDT